MLAYLIQRLLWAPVIVFAATFFIFMLTRFGPGDPVEVAAGPHATQETIDRVKEERGLDDPFYEQYADYMRGLITERDFGTSYTIYRGVPVSEIIFPRMMVSMQLGLVSLAIAFPVGIVVGLYSALKQGTWVDPSAIGSFLFFQSIPALVSVPLLVLIFGTKLHLLPTNGWEGPRVDIGPGDDWALGIVTPYIIIPAIALSLPAIAGVARLTRATTLSILGEDFVRSARAKGLSEFTVVTQHVARNALLPLVTVIGLSLATLLEGAFFTETILGIPGIGQLSFEAVTSRDWDIITAIGIIGAITFIMAALLVDLVYPLIDPRVSFGENRA
jgi:ABC-type dipeptide/oligopeptide/nickel transport system permease component